MGDRRNTRLTVGAIAIVLALTVAFSYKFNPVTNAAHRYATSVATASAGVYITLRSLNAFLSTAQEVEVGGSFVVSGTAQPLKVLEPIDDTIERVASMVFFLMVTTGILAVAMGPVSAVGFTMIAAALALRITGQLAGWGQTSALLSQRLGGYGAFLGLGLPVAFVLSALVADNLTEDVWTRHTAVIEIITARVGAAETVTTDGAGGFMQSIKSAYGEVDRYQELAQNIYEQADDLIASYIAILAVFVFKVIVLPALLMGGFFVIARFFSHLPPNVQRQL